MMKSLSKEESILLLENEKIKWLLNNSLMIATKDLQPYFIGDGQSWQREFEQEFYISERRSNIAELRNLIKTRIDQYQASSNDLDRKAWLIRLRKCVSVSDEALFKVAQLIGKKPSEGLFDYFQKIVNNFE